MAAIRRMLAALILGSALVARPAVGQPGSSVSLTHTVSVTVPPRIKVEVGAVAPMQSMVAVPSTRPNALAVSVSATQSWTLSIGSAKNSQLQWSTDLTSGFADVNRRNATIASGEISQIPAVTTLFFRNGAARKDTERSPGEDPDEVILTIVAP